MGIVRLFPSLSIFENMRMGGYQLASNQIEGRFAKVAELFPGLAERRNQRAGLLSGGERQMVAMGRALMMESSVLLLDEPSAGLSPQFQAEVFSTIKDISATGVSIVMVEQNAHRCLSIADRGYVLDRGKNAHEGSGRGLLEDPKVIELYLGTLARQRKA